MKLKRAKSDFTVNDLPKNRCEVFADCVKERFLLFLFMGLTLLLFALPLIFVTLLSDNTAGARGVLRRDDIPNLAVWIKNDLNRKSSIQVIFGGDE